VLRLVHDEGIKTLGTTKFRLRQGNEERGDLDIFSLQQDMLF